MVGGSGDSDDEQRLAYVRASKFGRLSNDYRVVESANRLLCSINDRLGSLCEHFKAPQVGEDIDPVPMLLVIHDAVAIIHEEADTPDSQDDGIHSMDS